ncbi:MAG: hypothetical protein U1G05_09720 [Kiritimatiellia bacterium]
MKYAVYREGVGADLPDFTKLTPAASGTVARIRLSDLDTAPGSNFGVVWDGEIEVASTGLVTVATFRTTPAAC